MLLGLELTLHFDFLRLRFWLKLGTRLEFWLRFGRDGLFSFHFSLWAELALHLNFRGRLWLNGSRNLLFNLGSRSGVIAETGDSSLSRGGNSTTGSGLGT